MKYRSCIEFLVVKMLSGKRYWVDILYRYFVVRERPSEIDRRFGKKGATRTVVCKTRNICSEATLTDERIYKALHRLKAEKPKEPNRCPICMKYINDPHTMEIHILAHHRDYVRCVVLMVKNMI